jgi:predicted deacylase
VIKYDPGEKGTVETEFVRANIPAVTFEMGRPSIWQHDMITRGVDGVRRVMAMLEMTGPAMAATNKPLVGNETTSLNATVGGFVEVKVALLEKVVKGQILAQQMNAFGDHLANYLAPHDGTVLAIGDEPTREPGSLVVRLIHWNPAEACKQGC